MSATVAVGAAEGANPTVYPCRVSVGGGKEQSVTVVVTSATLAAIPAAQQGAYLEARAMLAIGDSTDATATVEPYSNPGNPTWADQWLSGSVPS